MDSANILALVEQLDDEIDDLEESLEPLLKTALSETSSKLPLLDKAKLYVLATYAIESMLFSYLRLYGVKAREHPVFVELTRVKQYFDKIKTAETPPADRNLKLDKDAAHRFVRAGLAGNEKYDLQRAEREAKERAKAHIRFEELSKEINKKRKAEAIEETPAEDESDSSDSDSSPEEAAEVKKEPTPPIVKPKKKRSRKKKSGSGPDSVPASGTSTPSSAAKKKDKKAKKSKSSREERDAKKAEEGNKLYQQYGVKTSFDET